MSDKSNMKKNKKINQMNFSIIWKYSIRYFSATKLFFQEWIDLSVEIVNRLIIGFKSVNFVIYFVFVIIIIGGLGVFPDAYNYYCDSSIDNATKLAKALSTYFITIIATSAADLLINREPNEKEASKFRMPAFAFLVFGGISIFMIQYDLIPFITFNLSLTAAGLALFFWWITNSRDRKYKNFDDNVTNFYPLGEEIKSNILTVENQFIEQREVGPTPKTRDIKVKM